MVRKPTPERLLAQVNRTAKLADQHHAASIKLKNMLRSYYGENTANDDKTESFMSNDTFIDIADYGNGTMSMEEFLRILADAESGKPNF